MKPKSNGLVELAGENQKERGFFCMKLVSFMNEEAEPGTNEYAHLWEKRFSEAKEGRCAYKERCPIYKKTIQKHKQKDNGNNV